MVYLNRGIFDDASVSLITSTTVDEICGLAEQPPDVRRFRPNILIAPSRAAPFAEDAWLGGTLSFGDSGEAAAICVTHPDERCAMVNLSPDSALPTPGVLKAVVRWRDNKAGVYGTVTRRGRLTTGQPVFWEPAAASRGSR
jgi:uncharacterized protein YcbX